MAERRKRAATAAAEKFVDRLLRKLNAGVPPEARISRHRLKTILKVFFAELSVTIARDEFAWPKLGIFRPGWVSARTVTNPATKQPMRLPRKRKVHFRAAPAVLRAAGGVARDGRTARVTKKLTSTRPAPPPAKNDAPKRQPGPLKPIPVSQKNGRNGLSKAVRAFGAEILGRSGAER